MFFRDGHCTVTFSVEVSGGAGLGGKGILSSGCWDITSQPGEGHSCHTEVTCT